MRLAAGVVAGFLTLACAAHAQVSPNVQWSKHGDGWARVQISPGCHLVWFGEHRIYRQIDNITPDDRVDVVVQGSCNASGLAEGRVRIETTVHFPPTTDPSEAEYHYLGWRTVREGNARNGLLQGAVRFWDFERLQKPGVWDTPMPGFPEGLDTFFRDGCEYTYDEQTGQAGDPLGDGSHWGQCNPEGGQRLLSDFGAGPEPSAPAPSPAARLLSAVPAQPAPGNADVWSRCITVSQYPPDGGIQTVWALNNTCNTAVIVRFCFRAQYEAAGDPNLCRRREMRTQEIHAGGKYDFPFTLIAPGSSLTDGRVVRSNELLVSGFACTGGNFPDAYFDSDGAFRSHGC